MTARTSVRATCGACPSPRPRSTPSGASPLWATCRPPLSPMRLASSGASSIAAGYTSLCAKEPASALLPGMGPAPLLHRPHARNPHHRPPSRRLHHPRTKHLARPQPNPLAPHHRPGCVTHTRPTRLPDGPCRSVAASRMFPLAGRLIEAFLDHDSQSVFSGVFREGRLGESTPDSRAPGRADAQGRSKEAQSLQSAKEFNSGKNRIKINQALIPRVIRQKRASRQHIKNHEDLLKLPAKAVLAEEGKSSESIRSRSPPLEATSSKHDSRTRYGIPPQYLNRAEAGNLSRQYAEVAHAGRYIRHIGPISSAALILAIVGSARSALSCLLPVLRQLPTET